MSLVQYPSGLPLVDPYDPRRFVVCDNPSHAMQLIRVIEGEGPIRMASAGDSQRLLTVWQPESPAPDSAGACAALGPTAIEAIRRDGVAIPGWKPVSFLLDTRPGRDGFSLSRPSDWPDNAPWSVREVAHAILDHLRQFPGCSIGVAQVVGEHEDMLSRRLWPAGQPSLDLACRLTVNRAHAVIHLAMREPDLPSGWMPLIELQRTTNGDIYADAARVASFVDKITAISGFLPDPAPPSSADSDPPSQMRSLLKRVIRVKTHAS